MNQFDLYEWNPLTISLVLLVPVLAWLYYYKTHKETISAWNQAHCEKMEKLSLLQRVIYVLVAMTACILFLVTGRLLHLPYILEIAIIILVCGIISYDVVVIPFCSIYLDKLFDRICPTPQASSALFNFLLIVATLTYYLISRLAGVAIFCGMVMAVAKIARIILTVIM